MKKINKRKAFLNIIAGKATDEERRSFKSTPSGSPLVPKEVYNDLIGRSRSTNLLRKHGTLIKGTSDAEIPILTNDIEAVAHSEEYKPTDIVKVNQLGLDAELLSVIEFDVEVSMSRKLLLMNPDNQEMVIQLLKNAYTKKEIDYMYNGVDPKAHNAGSLFNRAHQIISSEPDPVKKIKEIRNAASTDVQRDARWIINKAAAMYAEDLMLPSGKAVLQTTENPQGDTNGAQYLLLGFPCDITDDIKPEVEGNALFYFGDFSSFVIRDDIDRMEIVTLQSKYADANELGFHLYHLADGKLVYSKKEITVFKSEFSLE